METLHPREEKQLKKGIIFAKRKALLAELKTLEQSLPPVDVHAEKPWWNQWKWMLTAVALVFICLSIVFSLKEKPIEAQPSPQPAPIEVPATAEDLIAQYFVPYPQAGADRSGDNTTNTIKTQAFEAYSYEDFPKAAGLFTESYEQSEDVESLFYAGVAYVGMREGQAAADRLERIPADNMFYEDSREYLGYAYFLKKDKLKLKDLIQLVKKEGVRVKLLALYEQLIE